MFLQSLVRFHQELFKILRKQNVSDTLSFVRTDGRTVRTDGRTDNVKTVYPPTNIVCGGYNQRTNGPVNAHLIYWPSQAQNIQFGKYLVKK